MSGLVPGVVFCKIHPNPIHKDSGRLAAGSKVSDRKESLLPHYDLASSKAPRLPINNLEARLKDKTLHVAWGVFSWKSQHPSATSGFPPPDLLLEMIFSE